MQRLAERRSAYAATLGSALAAREHGDLGFARRLLDGIEPHLCEFDWRLLRGLCAGDEEQTFDFGTETRPECLAWLPDGSKLAVITADGRIHFRDAQWAAAGTPRELPAGHYEYRGIPRNGDFEGEPSNVVSVVAA